MNKLTNQTLALILGLTTLGVIANSANAQELSTDNLQINTIEQQTTGQPIPGTTSTSVTAFMPNIDVSIAQLGSNETIGYVIAQNNSDPNILHRHDYSYIGLGGNVGLQQEGTGLGEASFVINGKVALARELSLRPAVVFSNDDTVFLVPLTYDFTIKSKDPFKEVPIVPFLGGGGVFTTNDQDNAGFLITGGADWRLSDDFVANAGLHVGFIEDSTDIGLVLGIGYIIPQKD